MSVITFPKPKRPPLPPDAAEDLDRAGGVLVYPAGDGKSWVAEGVSGNGSMILAEGSKFFCIEAGLDWVRRFHSGLEVLNRDPNEPEGGAL